MSRNKYVLCCAACAMFFIVLMNNYIELMPLNLLISGVVQRIISPPLTAVMVWVSRIGELEFYLVGIVVLYRGSRTRRTIGIPATAVLAVSALLNITLKSVFALPRPEVYRLAEASGFTFPSGHAMNAAAFYGFCAIAAVSALGGRGRKWQIITASAFGLFLLMMGFSRVYLGVHYAADVTGGYLLGVMLACAARLVSIRLITSESGKN